MAQKNSDAEEIFRKSEDEMSDIERMMAEILSDSESENTAGTDEESPLEDLKPVYASPAPPPRQRRTASSSASKNSREAKKETAHERGRGEPSAAYSYKQNTRREKKIKEASRKRSTAPAIAALVLIALLVIGALVYTKVFEDLRIDGILPGRNDTADTIEADVPTEQEAEELAAVSFPPDMVFPTPEPEDEVAAGTIKPQAPAGSIVIISDTQETAEQTEQAEAREHSYQFFTEDVSWTQAQQKCAELGGHLAVVSSVEELNTIVALAQTHGIEKVWLGCHRENGELKWENNETVDFYAWGRGEPSQYDSGDNVAEDYLLLWYFNGAWVYNDSRNDPVKDYPAMYSGKIGYVCEFE